MVRNFLKSGFLALLLVLFVGTEFHTHAEKETRTFSQSSYSAYQNSKQAPACPVCQFQRDTHSIWNPDFLTQNSFSIFQKEKLAPSKVLIPLSNFVQIRLGRAPPLSTSIS
ncbi:hypothetical protein LEP1GSC036_4021 [Leptospira weilii str. 2006001853]|uniref:Uncharacterized protein n=3 Tax=Leptospira weilii TaxID=28184 RepID=A0A828Z6B8_9LEPT|nr:hypothetical protein [Leptospira weilii]EMM72906.1 hypothetical protein LEP1GSC038_3566 [Leptospira weilii str. 2006001855]EKR65896.1 hypothetical protein LEP1GSC036_4021 [Leptospira weilii str. 2006001853]EMN89286.1 hypothetical protein LEP1GSC108_4540 [Leptospira weilii str. UI 13098]MCL8266035.1 hypothetical protein [Leptospira weilii]OMI18076.1 hypothetical protein BUQ74_06815 [Leptospira weilii serovar Heyan]